MNIFDGGGLNDLNGLLIFYSVSTLGLNIIYIGLVLLFYINFCVKAIKFEKYKMSGLNDNEKVDFFKAYIFRETFYYQIKIYCVFLLKRLAIYYIEFNILDQYKSQIVEFLNAVLQYDFSIVLFVAVLFLNLLVVVTTTTMPFGKFKFTFRLFICLHVCYLALLIVLFFIDLNLIFRLLKITFFL